MLGFVSFEAQKAWFSTRNRFCNGWDVYTGSAIPFTTTAAPFATALECVHRLNFSFQSFALIDGSSTGSTIGQCVACYHEPHVLQTV